MLTKRSIVAVSILVSCLSIARPGAQTVHPKGATIWNIFLARQGYTFISAPDGTARLVGMLGELVNTWSSPADPLLVKMPILSSPGHILAFRGRFPVPGDPRGRGSILTEYDYAGRIVWEYTAAPTIGPFSFAGFHHDMVRLENGNTLAMASVLVSGSPISPTTLIDDCLLEIDRAGNIVWAWFTHQHIEEFEFTPEAREQIWLTGGDWAHANAVTVIPANTLEDPRFAPGNLIVSYRNLNTIIVIDRATGRIVWNAGPNDSRTIGQHYAYLIPMGLEGAGRILAFDNGGSGGYPPIFRDHSRVVEIDPLLKTIHPAYTASKSGFQNWSMFSPFISNAQRLLGGNTLIVEGTKGRIFEVTAGGEIVWEYMSPFKETRQEVDGSAVSSYNIYRAFRVPVHWPYFPATEGSI